MTVFHVVTFVSEDGAYGGPTSVAFVQAEALAAQGQRVVLYAATDQAADRRRDSTVVGVEERLFPVRRGARKFSRVLSIRLLRDFRKHVRTADVVHVHLARDLVSMAAASLVPRRTRLVVQTHGMITPDERLTARVFDALLTRRVLRRARFVLVLTDQDARDVAGVAPVQAHRMRRLANAVPVRATPENRFEGRPLRAVFIARLQERKQPMHLVRAVEALGGVVTAELYGPDEGELPRIRAHLKSASDKNLVVYKGSLAPRDVEKVLRRSDVFVLPSRRETFPMSVLEALAVGTPAIVAADCGIAEALVTAGAAAVFDGSEGNLGRVLADLEADRQRLRSLSANGQKFVAEHYSVDELSRFLGRLYADR